jgi:hypothetical protein
MAISIRLTPRGRGVAVAAGFFAVLLHLEKVRNRRTSRPALRLTVRGDCLIFARANSAIPLAKWPLGMLDVRLSPWSAPTMSRTSSYTTVELPSVVVTKALPQPLTIGGLGYCAMPCGCALPRGPWAPCMLSGRNPGKPISLRRPRLSNDRAEWESCG